MKIESFINSVGGEHFDVIAQVNVKIFNGDLDYSVITDIEICPSEERLQCNAGKFSALHLIPQPFFSLEAINALQHRLEEGAMLITAEFPDMAIQDEEMTDEERAEDRRVEAFVQEGMDRRAEGY